MLLTKKQVEQVLPTCELPTSQKIIDYCREHFGVDWSKKKVYQIGQLSMLSKEKILDGIDRKAIQIYYENRNLYVSVDCDIHYEYDKNNKKKTIADFTRFNNWAKTLDENKGQSLQEYVKDKEFEVRQFEELVGSIGQMSL